MVIVFNLSVYKYRKLMIQSKGIFPTGEFNMHLEAQAEFISRHLPVKAHRSKFLLLHLKIMATLQNNISQSISEQHDFVGKMASDRRKTKKPLMEKLRRDRINSSLNEMKILVLESLNKDVSRYSKMEKADILEMTVKYLRDMNAQGRAKRVPLSWAEYRAGYNQCSLELMRNISTAATTTTPLHSDMHGKAFSRIPIGYHNNTHVSSHPPTFILPSSTTTLPTSPVGKIPTFVWVPIPSPPPSPSNKTTLGSQAQHTPVKVESNDVTSSESQTSKSKSTPKSPLPATPTMWRPW